MEIIFNTNFPADIVEEKIGYTFKNKSLLKQAFTRSSCLADGISPVDNEVLEFIGDSILGAIVTKKLVDRYVMSDATRENSYFECAADESELSDMKIDLVQRSSLAASTERLALENFLLMGKSDVNDSVQNQASVKEDLLEAIVGAVAIDTNWNMTILEELVENLIGISSILEFGRENAPNYTEELEAYFKKRGESLTFETIPPICKNLKHSVCVNLGMDMLNHTAYGYGLTEDGAKRMASKYALEHINTIKDRATVIINAVGKPDVEKAINQLQELYQKKIIPQPVYTFKQVEISENGNAKWTCRCIIDGLVSDNGGYICSSKAEAKKWQAFDALNYLIGRDLSILFVQNGNKI